MSQSAVSYEASSAPKAFEPTCTHADERSSPACCALNRPSSTHLKTFQGPIYKALDRCKRTGVQYEDRESASYPVRPGQRVVEKEVAVDRWLDEEQVDQEERRRVLNVGVGRRPARVLLEAAINVEQATEDSEGTGDARKA